MAVPFLTERGWHDATIAFWGVIGSMVDCFMIAFAHEVNK